MSQENVAANPVSENENDPALVDAGPAEVSRSVSSLDGQPVKRPRGRPRKVPTSIQVSSGTATSSEEYVSRDSSSARLSAAPVHVVLERQPLPIFRRRG